MRKIALEFTPLMFALALLSAAAFPPATQYTWRGHKCSYVKAGQGPPVLLLHGFAGSAFNCWRSTVPALAATHTVYGLDLLGLGASAQPANVEYSIDLARECASVGSPVRGVGMMNCGVGMNNKNALKVEGWRARQAAKGIDVEPAAEGWQLAFIGAVLALVDAIFNNRWLLTFILDKFATADNVRSALQRSVYVNPECVTDDLVDDYLSLATDKEAAVEVLRQIYTNDGGPLPFDAADALPDDLPILVVWGDTDNLAPITGPVGRYFRQRAQALPATRFEEIHAGHVPQDDSPEQTNAILREWLAAV